jgi:predicted  nucleic acid-binding Zn-ribbon protein
MKIDSQTKAKLTELEAEYNRVKTAADRIPALEKELQDANSKVASLTKQVEENKKAAAAQVPSITEEQALKTAGLLVERGLLKSEQKEAFASQILEDPSQLCDSIQKIAEFATAAQMGEPGDNSNLKVASDLDPIARFAMS